MSTSDTRYRLHELHRAGQVQRRRFGLFVGILVFASCGLFGWSATSAQAATDSLFAAPSAVGAGDCSSQDDACPIETAVTNANGEPVDDSVTIELAGGTYSLPSPSPTALSITFAGPSLTLKADGGTPILNGGNTVRLLSIDAASNVTIDGLEIESALAAQSGGGIDNRGTLTVENSMFSGNTARNGGGIANEARGTLTVQNSTFSDNSTTSVGGGAIIAFGDDHGRGLDDQQQFRQRRRSDRHRELERDFRCRHHRDAGFRRRLQSCQRGVRRRRLQPRH